MKRNILLLVIAFFLHTSGLLAHALWIETSTVGKAGQKQSIKIIYSEPNDKPEKIADWFSDVPEFTL